MGSSTNLHSGVSTTPTTTPWKIDALPAIEEALARQVGPLARLLLRKASAAAQRTTDKHEFLRILAEGISNEDARKRFMKDVGMT